MRACALVLALAGPVRAVVVDEEVDRELAAGRGVNLWVSFASDYAAPPANTSATRAERRQQVYDEARRAAEHSQRDAWGKLAQRGARFESLWISNSLYVQGATRDVVQQLRGLRGVTHIGTNAVIGHSDFDDTLHVTRLSSERCAEWAICPTDLGQGNPNCTRGVDVVTNSWGTSHGRPDTSFLAPVLRWREAGIVVVFSARNDGPNCGSYGTPGAFSHTISAGASDEQQRLASFSSRGPGPSGLADFAEQHPDVTGPGASVWGADNRGDTQYTTKSGTSMSCPAVAGLAALILSANPTLGHDDVKRIMQDTAQHTVGEPQPASAARTCNGRDFDEFPNYHYGAGIIDALAAVEAAAALPGGRRRGNATAPAAGRDPRWNLVVTKADQAWAVSDGDGITVANIDSGVVHTHESLVGSYRGNNGDGTFSHDYNWQSFDGRSPWDNNGHGTHTASTHSASRESGVGFAPGSQWVGCKIFA